MMTLKMIPKMSKLLLDKREEEPNLKPPPRKTLPLNNPRKTRIKNQLLSFKKAVKMMMKKMMMKRKIVKMSPLVKMLLMMKKDLLTKLKRNQLNKKKSSLVTSHSTLMRLLSNKDLKNTEPLLTLRSHLSKERAKVSLLLNTPSQLRPKKPLPLSMEPTLMVELSNVTSQLINQLEEVAMKLVPEPVEVEIVPLENPQLFSAVTLDSKPKLLIFKTSSLNAEKLRMLESP